VDAPEIQSFKFILTVYPRNIHYFLIKMAAVAAKSKQHTLPTRRQPSFTAFDAPTLSGMAFRALPWVMLRRPDAEMARNTVCETSVVEHCSRPAAGVVAIGALSWVVVGWRITCMAAGAIGEPGMVEHSASPAAGVMAARALPGIVAGWRIARVAADAIGESAVIEYGPSPAAGIVAV